VSLLSETNQRAAAGRRQAEAKILGAWCLVSAGITSDHSATNWSLKTERHYYFSSRRQPISDLLHDLHVRQQVWRCTIANVHHGLTVQISQPARRKLKTPPTRKYGEFCQFSTSLSTIDHLFTARVYISELYERTIPICCRAMLHTGRIAGTELFRSSDSGRFGSSRLTPRISCDNAPECIIRKGCRTKAKVDYTGREEPDQRQSISDTIYYPEYGVLFSSKDSRPISIEIGQGIGIVPCYTRIAQRQRSAFSRFTTSKHVCVFLGRDTI